MAPRVFIVHTKRIQVGMCSTCLKEEQYICATTHVCAQCTRTANASFAIEAGESAKAQARAEADRVAKTPTPPEVI